MPVEGTLNPNFPHAGSGQLQVWRTTDPQPSVGFSKASFLDDKQPIHKKALFHPDSDEHRSAEDVLINFGECRRPSASTAVGNGLLANPLGIALVRCWLPLFTFLPTGDGK
jgi:hypothetical protein